MDWVTADGHVNIDFLAEHYGQAQVMVSNTTRYIAYLHLFLSTLMRIPCVQ